MTALASRNIGAITRKSFPVPKKPSQIAVSRVKENVEASDKARRIRGFPVTSRAGGKSVYQGSSAKSRALKIRASDGFILMAVRNQSDVATRDRLRKSTKAQCTSLANYMEIQTEINLKT